MTLKNTLSVEFDRLGESILFLNHTIKIQRLNILHSFRNLSQLSIEKQRKNNSCYELLLFKYGASA